MTRYSISIILMLLGMFSLPGRAQTDSTKVLTLENCVEMALQNNKKSAEASNNILSAQMLSKEAFTKYFPEISAVGFAFWANHHTLQYNLLDLIELGIIKNGKSAGIQAMQPVFTGGQIVNGNKLAHLGEEVARLRAEQTRNEIRTTTESLYWKLNTLHATRTTLEAAVRMLDTLEHSVSLAVDAGLITRNDLLKVQLKRNTYSTEMVDLDNGIRLVKMLLGQYTGLGVTDNFEVQYIDSDGVPPMPLDLYMESRDAVLQTVDYNLLDKNVKAKELEKKMEIGKNLPTVALGAGWYYHDLLEQNHNFGAIQIGVAVPLSGWWGGSYSIKRKSIELINALNEKEDLSEKLQIDVQDKWNNLMAAHRKMQIENEGIAQSKENLRITRLYYEAGMNTISDLLEAETQYTEARGRFIAAYGNFRTSQCLYLVATGR